MGVYVQTHETDSGFYGRVAFNHGARFADWNDCVHH